MGRLIENNRLLLQPWTGTEEQALFFFQQWTKNPAEAQTATAKTDQLNF